MGYGSRKNVLLQAAVGLFASRAGLAWTSAHHTGVPVPTSAIGVGCQRFNGYYDNTRIFHKILAAMGPEQPARAKARAAKEVVAP